MNLGFALEYSLGHATHADNLKSYMTNPRQQAVRPFFVDIPFEETLSGIAGRLPGVRSNWSLRASLAAYLGLRREARKLSAALFHTQVTALLSTTLMRDLPSVVSLDATPIQYDRIGSHYNHTPSSHRALETLKKRINERAYQAARHLVTWSEWAKGSLVRDYGVSEQKVTVIPPGIDLERWLCPRSIRLSRRPVNLLFVGGDFQRKGGDTLLTAIQEYLPPSVPVHLDIVTRAPIGLLPDTPAIVHRGLQPNDDTLRRLYADADIFVFPTRADCLPLAVLEAMAAGLPVITTDVGALSEAIGQGDAGMVIPSDDPKALAHAIAFLAQSPELRYTYGLRAREIAEERFDGSRNYARLVTLLSEMGAQKA